MYKTKTFIEQQMEGLTKEDLKSLLEEKESVLKYLSDKKINKPMQNTMKAEIKIIKNHNYSSQKQ
jgi:hypothetical protein